MADYLRGWDLTINKQEAVDGDIVICKCERHPRVVAVYARRCTYQDTWGGDPFMSETPRHSVAPAVREPYDEQYMLKGSDGKALAGVRYRIVMDRGRVITGTTDTIGRTERITTDGMENLKLQLEN